MSTAKKIVIAVIAAVSLITITYFNATKANPRQLKVREETIRSSKIKDDLDGFLIVFFSDMSYGRFFDDQKLDKVVKIVNDFDPDLIIFGGDLLDEAQTPMSQEARDELEKGLSALEAKYGKFAVLGDEDMASMDKVTNILETAGFTMLENRTAVIGVSYGERVNLIGLGNVKNGDPDLGIISGVDTADYSILISHCPDLFEEVKEYSVDYMLAGHSRNGQVYLPLINLFYRDAGCQEYYRGRTTKKNTTLDISNGLGQKDHDVRLNSDPEIVLYKLLSK